MRYVTGTLALCVAAAGLTAGCGEARQSAPGPPSAPLTALSITSRNISGPDAGVTQQLRCRDTGSAQVSVPAGLRLLDDRNATRACRLLQRGAIPVGEHGCPRLNRETPQVQLRGVLRGRRWAARFSDGPCAAGRRAWPAVAALWQVQVAPTLPKNLWQKVLVLQVGDPGDPVEFAPPDPQKSWRRQWQWPRGRRSEKNLPPCTLSMPQEPTVTCRIPTQGQPLPLLTLALSSAQARALKSATPQQVLQILAQAQRIPAPPGFPGGG